MGFGAICYFPSNGASGRFNLAALRGCHTFNVCLFDISAI
jgi:hypothetical protein